MGGTKWKVGCSSSGEERKVWKSKREGGRLKRKWRKGRKSKRWKRMGTGEEEEEEDEEEGRKA